MGLDDSLSSSYSDHQRIHTQPRVVSVLFDEAGVLFVSEYQLCVRGIDD